MNCQLEASKHNPYNLKEMVIELSDIEHDNSFFLLASRKCQTLNRGKNDQLPWKEIAKCPSIWKKQFSFFLERILTYSKIEELFLRTEFDVMCLIIRYISMLVDFGVIVMNSVIN